MSRNPWTREKTVVVDSRQETLSVRSTERKVPEARRDAIEGA
jgi:hypothetical protein